MSAPTREDVAGLLRERLGEVLAADPAGIPEGARFEEDLAADSLDRIEMVEAVEAELRARGLAVALPDEEIEALRTVREAIDRVHARVTAEEVAP